MLCIALIWFFKGYLFTTTLYIRFNKDISLESAEKYTSNIYKHVDYTCNESKTKRPVYCRVRIYTNPIRYKAIRKKIESSLEVTSVGFLYELMKKGPEGEGF